MDFAERHTSVRCVKPALLIALVSNNLALNAAFAYRDSMYNCVASASNAACLRRKQVVSGMTIPLLRSTRLCASRLLSFFDPHLLRFFLCFFPIR